MTTLGCLTNAPCKPCGKDTLHIGSRCRDCGAVPDAKRDKSQNILRAWMPPAPKVLGAGKRGRAMRRGGA